MFRVVLFTGGRGSGVLSSRLIGDSNVDLVLAINGYDDGDSTGEVRRFLGHTLGPSDYRKNASRVAAAKRSCSTGLIDLLDARLPKDMSDTSAVIELARIGADTATGVLARELRPAERQAIGQRLATFLDAHRDSGKSFRFADCSVGNLVFAGSYLKHGCRFNQAIDDYASLVGLPPGLIENVTDGTNAYLVAVDEAGRLLETEAAIVSTPHRSRIVDLFLLAAPLDERERAALTMLGREAARRALEARAIHPPLNPRLARKVDEADLIIYAPGTQHSSLYPSYLTAGLGQRIARNLRATKLLITNLEPDAEIRSESAVTLVQRALHYLSDKGRRSDLGPCLVTHYLLNDPAAATSRPLVPLGQVSTLDDPRMVRISNFEDGVTGRHDAGKILGPFLEARTAAPPAARVAIFLYGHSSPATLAQTLIEIGLSTGTNPATPTVFIGTSLPLPADVQSRLPFEVRAYDSEAEAEWWLRLAVQAHEFDSVALFESSGGYRASDLAGLFHYLSNPRIDAVWGSRRLSLRDIHEAYRQRQYRNRVMRAISRAGSHVLSAAYLILYGRYISDTLSGVRILKASEIANIAVSLRHAGLNQYLLANLLRRKADILEVPVQFFPRPRATRALSLAQGVATLAVVIGQKLLGTVSTIPWEP